MSGTQDKRDVIRALQELVRRLECGEYRLVSFDMFNTNNREQYVTSYNEVGMDTRYRTGIGLKLEVMSTYDAMRNPRGPYDGRGSSIFDPPVSGRYDEPYQRANLGPPPGTPEWQLATNNEQRARERVEEARRDSAMRAEAEMAAREGRARRAEAARKRLEAKRLEEEAERNKPRAFGARDLDID